MISPTLTDTELRLDKGEATVEVAELHPENNALSSRRTYQMGAIDAVIQG
jgi:hypothetical protein